MKKILIKLIIIVITFIIGRASFLISGKNNVVEQAAEAVLRTQGVDVDISAEDNDCLEISDGSEKMDKNP